MHKFKNYIFDMDGTLINSSEEVLKCFKQAFKEAKYEIDTAKLTSDVIGPPLRQIIDLIAPDLVDEEKINEIISNFRRIYDYSEDDVSVMYSGIYDLLVNLNFVASKGEAKRLIQGGGVKLDGEKISDMGFVITSNMNQVLQAGKRKFAKLV